ncbi:hypothetical protein GSI_14240 [Ganoderma sinense ZZ0214-1]|uniref:Uncharacterized protein n=1 Tax=Ganoderma sinense ZZ0214-1 TaxID=1077348 RepID=A0A2G8RSJ3_9APHY|nr:hypothetical protein GSI_14240 [Ganoderma sinense ZZ0214-1]
MGARTTRRRPLPVARRHRQGLLCRAVIGRRASPPARPLPLLPRVVVPSVVCSSLGCCSRTRTFRSLRTVCPPLRAVSITRPFCPSALTFFFSLLSSGAFLHILHSPPSAAPVAVPARVCFVDCLFSCRRPSVVHLYHRSFHITHTPSLASPIHIHIHAPHSVLIAQRSPPPSSVSAPTTPAIDSLRKHRRHR